MSRGVCVLLWVLIPTAWAGTPKAPPFVELKKDFAAGEFERVIKRASAALKAAPKPADAAQLQLWRGQALLALGKEAEAEGAFAAAVEADGEVELDAQRASPDALRVFTKARQSVPGTLAISVREGAATVRIDDRELGPTPLVTQVPAGRHAVEARGTGQRSARQEVEIAPGRRLELTLELKAPEPEPKPEAPAVAAAEKKAEAQPPPVAPPDASRPAVVTQTAPAPATRSQIGWAPLLGGVALAAGGGILLWQAHVAYDALDKSDRPALSAEEERAAMSNGPLFQTLGWVGLGVGAAAAIAGAVLLIIAPGTDAQASVMLLDGGAGIAVSGRWP